MATPYSNIFTRFLRKIYDISLANNLVTNVSLAESQMIGYMNSAVENYTQCLVDLNDKDDTLKRFNQTLKSYDEEIISILMTVEWVTPFITSVMNLQPFLNDSEFKGFSQANFLDVKKELKKDLMAEAETLINKRSYANMDYTNFN